MKLVPKRILALATALFFAFGSSKAAAQLLPDDQRYELIVLYNENDPTLPATAENIVEGLPISSGNPTLRLLRESLGNPESARFLLSGRESRAVRSLQSIDDPEERLQRYVVLHFPSAAALEDAKKKLATNRAVLSVEENLPIKMSATITDPFYAPPGNNPWEYQWGLYDSWLNMALAWDRVHGTAYVGTVDNGVDSTHPDLSKAFRRFYSLSVQHNDSDVDELRGHNANYQFAGHGTHVAGIIAADTSMSGAPAGYRNPTNSVGGAGICRDCTLLIADVSSGGIYGWSVPTANVIAGFAYLIESGAQVINMSFGIPDAGIQCTTPPMGYAAYCTALQLASNREVVVVAAAGNDQLSAIDFPARDSRVIPVGGINSAGAHWLDNDPNGYGSNIGSGMETRGLVAPARDVLSTVYRNRDWSAGARCGEDLTGSFFLPAGYTHSITDGYGTCTGTSMAAPHVSGIAALVRTVNPLLTANQVRQHLLTTAHNSGAPNPNIGFGIPRANMAITQVYQGTNGLTPLFSFTDAANSGIPRFHTIVPQMGTAAVMDTLRPRDYSKVGNHYNPIGTGVLSNYMFPGTAIQAKAKVWVFTTHVNPKSGTSPLQPLRMYVKCGVSTVCTSTRQQRYAHAYATSLSDETSLLANSFRYVGIEGYVYPITGSQPTGTVRLMRAYNKDYKTYAIFPEGETTPAGFDNPIALGFVYPNTGPRPTIL